jgi:uncharacterized OB-fold protein
MRNTNEDNLVTRCDKCGRLYDDYNQWTLCPHGPLEFPHDDYCWRCDTVKSVHGECVHQSRPSENQHA